MILVVRNAKGGSSSSSVGCRALRNYITREFGSLKPEDGQGRRTVEWNSKNKNKIVEWE
jgi:hypothetical protein